MIKSEFHGRQEALHPKDVKVELGAPQTEGYMQVDVLEKGQDGGGAKPNENNRGHIARQDYRERVIAAEI
jgi:hypothetical protein